MLGLYFDRLQDLRVRGLVFFQRMFFWPISYAFHGCHRKIPHTPAPYRLEGRPLSAGSMQWTKAIDVFN